MAIATLVASRFLLCSLLIRHFSLLSPPFSHALPISPLFKPLIFLPFHIIPKSKFLAVVISFISFHKTWRGFGIAAWLLASYVATACPAGYESHAALLQSARLIIGVKVETVTDAPPIKRMEGGEPPRQGDNPGKHAQARVQVTEILRGKCSLKQFNLIGGPYATCAPGAHYVNFKQGEIYYLILDRLLPDDSETIVITWRCRVFHGSRAELDAMLQRTNDQRNRMVERHRKIFPQAMVLAKTLLPSARKETELKLPSATPYSVLACLRLLLCDPENFRLSEFEDDEAHSIDSFVTADHTTPWQAQALDEALTARAKSHPQETADFNRQLLIAYIIDETGISDATARKIGNDEFATKHLAQVQGDALAFDLDLRSEERETSFPSFIRTASLLLITADEADDRMVWRTFGFGFGHTPALDADLFLPMVERHPERFAKSWGSTCLLLAMPDPRLAPEVKKLMLQTENDSRLHSFFCYFAKLNDEPTCHETLAIFERVSASDLANIKDPEQRQRALEFTSYLVEKFTEAAETNQLKSQPLHQRLEHLSTLYPKKAVEKTPSNDDDPFAPSAK